MKTEFVGKALVVGNNVDTDLIYPGRFLELTDPKEIGSHCLAGISEDISPNFPKGGIVVAGTNFGCGSSREHAPIALRELKKAIAYGMTTTPELSRTISLWLRKSIDVSEDYQEGLRARNEKRKPVFKGR